MNVMQFLKVKHFINIQNFSCEISDVKYGIQ